MSLKKGIAILCSLVISTLAISQDCFKDCGETALVTSGQFGSGFSYNWVCTDGTLSTAAAFNLPISQNSDITCFVTITNNNVSPPCIDTSSVLIDVTPEVCDCAPCPDGLEVQASCGLALADLFCNCNQSTIDILLIYHSSTNNFATANLISTVAWTNIFHTYTPPQGGGYLWHVWRDLDGCCPDITETTCYSCTSCQSTLSLSEGPVCTINANVTGCQGTPSYNWSTSQTSSSITVPQAGTYCVTVTGCCQSPMTACYTTTACSSCNDPTVTISGSCSFLTSSISGSCPSPSRQWYRNGIPISGATGSSYNPNNVSGVYSLIVNCSNGCGDTSNSISLNCTQPCNSTVTLNETLTCVQLQASISGTPCPGATYTFFDPNNNVVQSGTSSTYSSTLIDGTYTVTVNGCPNCGTLTATEVTTNCSCQCNMNVVADCDNITVTLTGAGCSDYTNLGILKWGNNSCTNSNCTHTFLANPNSQVYTFQTDNGTGCALNGTNNTGYQAVLSGGGCPTQFSNCATVPLCVHSYDLKQNGILTRDVQSLRGIILYDCNALEIERWGSVNGNCDQEDVLWQNNSSCTDAEVLQFGGALPQTGVTIADVLNCLNPTLQNRTGCSNSFLSISSSMIMTANIECGCDLGDIYSEWGSWDMNAACDDDTGGQSAFVIFEDIPCPECN